MLWVAISSTIPHISSSLGQDISSPPLQFLPPSPPLPSLAVQLCSFKVFWREDPASACQVLLCCGNAMEH